MDRSIPRISLALAAVAGLALALLTGNDNEAPGRPSEGRWADSERAYLEYLRAAPELQPVRRIPARRWDTWLYMPWRYRWPVGTGEKGGRFCRSHGIRGGFLDHGHGPLAWLERWDLSFYVDHVAGKGDLHLVSPDLGAAARDPRAVRPRPLDGPLLRKLEATIARNLQPVRASPSRVAYALDDEISWGSFVRPVPWRLHGDDGEYARWLRAYYGEGAPPPRFVTPDEVLPRLRRPLAEIDLSPFLDRMTWNDSVWATFLGKLVERCNREDPETPCGFVGGQAPNLWGGYDWARLARKIQFVEAYDLGSSLEILRSLAPEIPRVTTHFHDEEHGAAGDAWLAWHRFAHGDRGMIAWVDERWWDAEGRPRPWLAEFARTLRELSDVQGPKLAGARWLHDGVALYYSHPSVQVSWMLDAEAHGRTWPNRNDDHRLGTSHLVRQAWELLLTDAGLQYDFVSSLDVALRGVPKKYRILILPAAWALSDLEARRIAEFARRGGTVIADFAPGLFDHHGRGRARGALDELFGVRHDGTERAGDFFDRRRLWVETDQDAGYGYRRFRELFSTLEPRLHRVGGGEGFAIAEPRLPVATSRRAGQGRAVYLNLSPQRYLMMREEGSAGPEDRAAFLDPVLAVLAEQGASRWIEAVDPETGQPVEGLEITAWEKEGRTLVFVHRNLPVAGGPRGGGRAVGLTVRNVPLELRLAGPVRQAVDERTGRKLPDGRRFRFTLNTAEATFFSFEGGRPRGTPPATLDAAGKTSARGLPRETMDREGETAH